MSSRPLRFVHAGDLHLEQPPHGLPLVPEHLAELLADAPYRAAAKVFELAVQEDVDFVVLSGDVLDVEAAGPRGTAFLLRQFEELSRHGIAVYWAGGPADPPESWPDVFPLPANVHVFSAEAVEDFTHRRDGLALARLTGTSRPAARAEEFHPDSSGLFSVAVVHDPADCAERAERGIDYWALGGRHHGETEQHAEGTVAWPGTPQGRHPGETGAHGCLLVSVDEQGGARCRRVATDVVRWRRELIEIDEDCTIETLREQMRARLRAARAETPGAAALLVSWTIAGDAPLARQLLREADDCPLLAELQTEFGHDRPAAWSCSLAARTSHDDWQQSVAGWQDEDTFLGEFLRAIERLRAEDSEAIDLSPYLGEATEPFVAGEMRLDDPPLRRRVLDEVACLGVDLLAAEEV